MNPAIDGEIDDEAPARSPTRRDGRVIAMPAKLSTARDFTSGVGRSTEIAARRL